MPRQRLTNEQAALKGADKVNPGRFRDRKKAPKHDAPVGNPPATMGEPAKLCWFEFVTYAIPGTLTAADRLMLESASNLLAEYRVNPVEFTAAKLGRLFQALSSFGMTPVDRQKLGAVGKEPDANPFASLDS